MNNYIFPFLWMRDQDEEVLREEIVKIDECGIKAVCLESRPHPDFGGEGWWKDFDIVIEEAKKRDMKIWILDDAHFPTGQANGMLPAKHPDLARKYVMMQHTDCVGPLVQGSLDVNLFMTKAFTWLDFGKPQNKPLIDEQKLLSVVAYPVIEDDILGENYIDLTDKVAENGWVTFDLPEGVWRICVSFETYDFGARNEYINYVDEKSVRVLIDAIYEPHYEHYKEEFGKTIVGFFSDEPGFYNVDDFDMNDAIGRKKMALPWGDELKSFYEMENEQWKQTLPLLWFACENEKLSSVCRMNYMNKVSFLYSKNFSGQLGKWCSEHGVQYIGHVIEDNGEHCRLGCGAGHYFRAVDGQHMAGIDTIGGQIIPGNPYASRHGVAYVASGKFNHFGLAKMGASAAQIDPKKNGRLMCEAFGAYGWNLGVRGMKWIADYLLVQGVNHFVPHAFSMADYPDDDCPPHFYARGNNPQFPYFAETMKYVNKMCDVFNNGMNVPVAALLYPAEHDWMCDCMPIEVPGQILQENQLDYEIIPVDAFSYRDCYNTIVKDGKLIINNREMKLLIIPETKYLEENTAKFIREAAGEGLKVVFINNMPSDICSQSIDAQADNSKLLDEIRNLCDVVSLEFLADYMKKNEYYDIILDNECKDILYYHYKKNEDIYFIFNSSVGKKAVTKLYLDTADTVVKYDVMNDNYYSVPCTVENGKTAVDIDLAPYDSIILMTGVNSAAVVSAPAELKPCASVDISEDWMVSSAKSIDYPNMSDEEEWKTLLPYSQKDFGFSGIMRYRKSVAVPEGMARIIFKPEYIYEVAEVFVDGVSAGKKVTPAYEWDITDLCRSNQVEICVEVANTPTRDTLKSPGIFGPTREVMEPSGMFGKVVLEGYR